MSQIIFNFLQGITTNHKILITLISMFPLIELKGAIPIGVGILGENIWKTAALAYVGSTAICLPVFFLLIPIFNLLKKIKGVGRFFEKVEQVFKDKAEKIAVKTGNKGENGAIKILQISLLIFVAVPFPVTGIWTGTAIAVFLKLKFCQSVLPLAVGNLIAGFLITVMTILFKQYVDIIIYILFAIAIIMLMIFIIKVVKAKPKI